MSSNPDIVIIGSGMGGATAAYALAPTGARILILEKGHQLPDTPENRDARAIFQRGHFRPKERWYDSAGAPFNPGNYYNHGGNSKFYGAVLTALSRRGFRRHRPCGRRCPGLAVPLCRTRALVRPRRAALPGPGCAGRGPDRAAARQPFPHPPVPDEPAIARVARSRRRSGFTPFRCRSGSTSTLARPREDPVGRLPGRAQRQDGRRDLRADPGARTSQRDDGERRRGACG